MKKKTKKKTTHRRDDCAGVGQEVCLKSFKFHYAPLSPFHSITQYTRRLKTISFDRATGQKRK